MIKGFCMRCRKQTEMENTTEVITKNKRRMLKGVCSKCGTKMCKILGKKND